MPLVHWDHRPTLRHPTLLAAFEGWNDAGDAASLALAYLEEDWGAEVFARVDTEELYDFTSTRPQVRLVEGGSRSIEWPGVELLSVRVPGTASDVVLLRGAEPQLRWRAFSAAVVEVAQALGVEMSVMLGALLADVPHTRPVRVSGSSDDHQLAKRLGLVSSTYEGPTGIVGVLHQALSAAGIPAVSLWAAVPHYVQQVPSPKAALALVRRAASTLGVAVDPLELQVAAEEYERQVSARVADDEDAAAYVAQLEEADDSQPDTGALFPSHSDAWTDEIEKFLRQHRSDG